MLAAMDFIGVQSIFIVALVATESAAVSRWLDAVVGGAVALVYLRTRRIDQRTLQVALVAGIVAALIALIVVGIQLYGF